MMTKNKKFRIIRFFNEWAYECPKCKSLWKYNKFNWMYNFKNFGGVEFGGVCVECFICHFENIVTYKDLMDTEIYGETFLDLKFSKNPYYNTKDME